MNRFMRVRIPFWVLPVAVLGWGFAAFGQEKPAQNAPAQKTKPGYRTLAEGVLKPVSPARQVAESFSRHNVVELLAVDAKFDWAKNVDFRRDIWSLEFNFKPVRMVWVDVPQPSGKMRRKLIWYMIYNVTNPGKIMHPVKQPDGTFKPEFVDREIRFVPKFLLESTELGKAYPDRVIPVALGPIQLREDLRKPTLRELQALGSPLPEKPARQFLTSVEICRKIQVGQTLWGVAMWEDIDPRIDRFSIYVEGLTSAYKWKDDPGKYKAGAPLGTYRQFTHKILKLNFWRPGDEFFEHEREVRFGAPGEVDYEWVYR